MFVFSMSALADRASFSQPKQITHVLISATDLQPTYSYLQKFGFQFSDGAKTPEANAEIVRMKDGQIGLSIIKNSLLKDKFIGLNLAMFTDSIETVAAWLKGLNYNPDIITDDHNSISEIDVMAPGNVRLFIHPKKDIVYPEAVPNPTCGEFLEFSTCVTDVETGIIFWERFGYRIVLKGFKPHPYAILRHENNLSISLQTPDKPLPPSLDYGDYDAKQKVAAIRTSGVEPFEVNMQEKGETDNAMFRGPEGLVINIFTIKK
jgi:hypothetical protein